MDLKQIIKDVHQNAINHGWWDDYKIIMKQYERAKNHHYEFPEFEVYKKMVDVWENARLNWIAAKLALIHSEVSELEEATSEENFAEELADICIRTFDLLGGLGINIEELIYFKTATSTNKINRKYSIHWYISNTVERLRNDDDYFDQELLNIWHRCLLEAIDYGVNLEQAIKKKMEYNKDRPYKHGKRL